VLNAKRGQKVLNPTTQHNITDIKYMGQVFGSFLGGTWNERYKKNNRNRKEKMYAAQDPTEFRKGHLKVKRYKDQADYRD